MTTILEHRPDDSREVDVPRDIERGAGRGDAVFIGAARSVGLVVLAITGAIGIFLGLQMVPTLHHYGWHFFTQEQWDPERNVLGIAAAAVGTVEVALIALVLAFPLALLTALFITELAPRPLKSTLVALVDLMAAIPSIAFGYVGLLLIEPHAIHLARWISEYLGWIPLFKVDTLSGFGPHSASWAESDFGGSPAIAGLIVALMVIPLTCAVMRGVFDQTPIGEREAALALGSTRWGVIRTVVLPFGRGGIIGGTMLGLGRALGETVAVLLILSPATNITGHILQQKNITISALIGNFFPDSTSVQLDALLAAGFVLFLMTLVINLFAARIVTRSRSGADTT